MAEEWRPIPSCPGYEASSLGRIRSVDRIIEHIGRWGTPRRTRLKGRVLRLQQGGSRGLTYLIFQAGLNNPRRVNRAVCEAFHGRPPTRKHEAAHLNGKGTDNVASNLKWATGVENWAHRYLHRTATAGDKNPCAKLTEMDIPLILSEYADGASVTVIARSRGVTARNLRKVLKRETWRHVAVPPALVRRVGIRARWLLDLG